MYIRFDRTRFDRRRRAVWRARPRIMAAALREGMRRAMMEIAAPPPLGVPRDTNRLVRGWIEAANSAGLGPMILPPLRRSSRRQHQLDRLTGQVAFWKRIVARYRRQGREDRWALAARVKLEKARMHLRRFLGDDYALVVGLFSADTEGPGRSVAATVRTRLDRTGAVLGGRGRLVMLGAQPLYVMHNREPHASFRRNRAPVTAALRRLRASGIRRRAMRKAAARALAAAARAA